MDKIFFKTLGATIIVFVFVFLAFGSEPPQSSNNSSSSSNDSTSTSYKDTRTIHSGGYPVEIDLTVPDGYIKGGTCSSCDGGGVTNYQGTDMICPNCAGRGFDLIKK